LACLGFGLLGDLSGQRRQQQVDASRDRLVRRLEAVADHREIGPLLGARVHRTKRPEVTPEADDVRGRGKSFRGRQTRYVPANVDAVGGEAGDDRNRHVGVWLDPHRLGLHRNSTR